MDSTTSIVSCAVLAVQLMDAWIAHLSSEGDTTDYPIFVPAVSWNDGFPHHMLSDV